MREKELLSINPLLADRTRLAIIAALASAEEEMDFRTLVEGLSLTGGNLSVHASKLENAGLIRIEKKFVGKSPQTLYAITDAGRQAIRHYLATLETVLHHSKGK